MLVEGTALGAGTVVAGVVGVVAFLAAGALIEAPAHLGCPAREDVPDGPIVGSVELPAMGTGVGRPVLAQKVCEGKGHR